MKKKLMQPSRYFAVLAFLLLWVTQGLYYFLEFTLNIRLYIFEGIWCALVFSLCLFGAPRLVSFLVNLAGVIALINIYALNEGTNNLSHFAPALLFAVMLFTVWQYHPEKDSSFITQICQNLFLLMPVILLGLIIYGAINLSISFSTNSVYFILLSLCVCALYFCSAMVKYKKDGNENHGKLNRITFIIAGILVLESSAYCLVFSRLELSNCVPLLWVAVYFLLLDCKNPVCVNTAKKLKGVINGFLKLENKE